MGHWQLTPHTAVGLPRERSSRAQPRDHGGDYVWDAGFPNARSCHGELNSPHSSLRQDDTSHEHRPPAPTENAALCQGSWSVMQKDWAWGMAYVIETPFAWFLINLFFWFTMGYGLYQMMNRLSDDAADILTMHVKLNIQLLSVPKIRQYLRGKGVQEESVDLTSTGRIRKLSWKDTDNPKWKDFARKAPQITLQFDEMNLFLISVILTFESKSSLHGQRDPVQQSKVEQQMKSTFFDGLIAAGILEASAVQALLAGQTPVLMRQAASNPWPALV